MAVIAVINTFMESPYVGKFDPQTVLYILFDYYNSLCVIMKN